jgi:hypothetical protein
VQKNGRFPARLPERAGRCLSLPDHLIRLEEDVRGDRQVKGLGGLEIDDQLELGGLLYGQIARLRSFQNLVDVYGGPSKELGMTCAGSVANFA